MKNYYQILGLPNFSDLSEIKKKYRTLAIQLHPDRNPGNERVAKEFQNINEAYNELKQPENKKLYDNELNNFLNTPIYLNPSNFNEKSNLEPEILFFYCSGSQIFEGDTVTFYWRTQNADVVYLYPLGQVKPFGTKKIKFNKLTNSPIRVDLVAYNIRSLKKNTQSFRIEHIWKLPKKERNKAIFKRVKQHLKKFYTGYISLLVLILIFVAGINGYRRSDKDVHITIGENSYTIITQQRYDIEPILKDSFQKLYLERIQNNDSFVKRAEQIIYNFSKKYPRYSSK